MHPSPTSLCLTRLRFFIYLVLVAALVSTKSASAGATDSTAIVILGTVHNKTENYTAQGIYEIMERVKPDLILVELDSSFLTPPMSIKPDFVRISLENEAVAEYQKAHGTAIRPYDIEGRNKIYQAHNYFKLQQDLSKALNRAVQDSLLRGASAMLLEALDRFDDIGRSFGSESPRVMNSSACDVAMESKQFYAGDGMVRIVASVPTLRQYVEFAAFRRDFWIQRNDAMVTNILSWTNRLHPMTVLVLCGFEHRYYLRNELKAHRTAGTFKLREYWTY